jgi:hypothetical protein
MKYMLTVKAFNQDKHQRTWEAQLVPRLQRGKRADKPAELMTSWESDQLIGLTERVTGSPAALNFFYTPTEEMFSFFQWPRYIIS